MKTSGRHLHVGPKVGAAIGSASGPTGPTVPGKPTAVSATAGDTEAEVSFTAPANDGGDTITGYRVTSTPGSITATGASSPITITGLTNGVEYTFTVAATNSIGYGAESDPSNAVTPSAAASYTDIIADGVLFGDGTFTRASAAFEYNSSGMLTSFATDTLRLGYNPVSLALRGALIEESRLNAESDSQDVSAWTSTFTSVTTDTVAAPDGNTTADTLTTTSTLNARVLHGVSVSSGVQIYSVYLKAGTASWAKLDVNSFDVAGGAWFNLGAGSVGTVESGFAATIEDVGGGWYRCSISFTTTTDTTGNIRIFVTDDDNTVGVTNGVTIHVWQADINSGSSVPTSPVPTTGSTASRAADVCTVSDLTDIAHDASVGTVYVEAVAPPSVAVAATIWSLNDNTANEVIRLHMEAGGALKAQVIDGGSTVADINIGTLTARQAFKAAMSYEANDIKACLNGGTVGTDASATLPTVDRMMIGRGVSGSYWNGWVKDLSYAPTADDTQALTT